MPKTSVKPGPNDLLCLFGCNRRVVTRGVCGVCYVMILRLVKRGLTSWKELESLNLAAPVDPKVAAHRSRIASGWVRQNRILLAIEAVKKRRLRAGRGMPH